MVLPLTGCYAGEENLTDLKSDDALTTLVFKNKQSVQCQPDSGISLQDMATELADAGVAVHCSAVGYDGNMYPSMCGAADGKINVYKINIDDVSAAEDLGFSLLESLPRGGVQGDCQ